MTSVNPEISCIRMGSGPALFGLSRFYCIRYIKAIKQAHVVVCNFKLLIMLYQNNQNNRDRHIQANIEKSTKFCEALEGGLVDYQVLVKR